MSGSKWSVCSAFLRPARCSDQALRPNPWAAFALITLLASCQPLPHPFAEDRPPDELLAVPESVAVSIAPVEGQPMAVAAKLGAATARALLGHDIPASEKTTIRGSYQLYGHLTQSKRHGKSALAVLWRLENAKGREIGEREVGIKDTAKDWRSAETAMIERLAALSADAVMPLLVKEPEAPRLAALAPPLPKPTAAEPIVPNLPSAKPAVTPSLAAASRTGEQKNRQIRVALRRVTGAPGDGAVSLARAVTSVLRQQDLTIADPGGKADFTIDSEVSIAPIGPNKQHVKIVWHVRNASGAELGTVGQENDVPRGLLSGRWGDVAYVVAIAASDGLLQVLAHAAPSTTTATHEPPNAGPGQLPSSRPSQPAASAVKAAETKGLQ
jgi:hypothetical protein